MTKSKVLVTGGVGYIGSHTTVELIKAGYDVVIVDNLSNSEISMLAGVERITDTRPIFELVDMTTLSDLEAIFKKHPEIESVIHFAAFKAVDESVENPVKYYRNNMISLLNLMRLMVKYKTKNLVFSSSCTVYGTPDELPVTEKSPIKKSVTPYGETKQMAERVIQDTVAANTHINSIALRYFNPIGAHSSGLIGELPLGIPGNLMPYITQTAIGKRSDLKVFGNDYDTPDGSAIRDYIHVVDLAKAHIAALKRLNESQNQSNFEVFNVGTGNGHSVIEVIQSFEKMSGIKLDYTITERRAGDIPKIWGSTKLANKGLNWHVEKTLDEMTESAWKWEQNLKKGFK